MAIEAVKLEKIVTDCLKDFYNRRMENLKGLKLKKILSRKNPYLYKALGTNSATEIVEGILQAYLTSSDEGIFGDAFFEPVAKAVSHGRVSPSEGVDIAVETDDKYLAISVKSGPFPFNSSQKKRQNDEFMSLRSRLLKLKKHFDALLGHCYGKVRTEPNKNKIYRDRSGQEFWYELTGEKDFYIRLINAMQNNIIAIHKNEYELSWQQAVNKYVREFTNDFCDDSGAVLWEKLLEFNSGMKENDDYIKQSHTMHKIMKRENTI